MSSLVAAEDTESNAYRRGCRESSSPPSECWQKCSYWHDSLGHTSHLFRLGLGGSLHYYVNLERRFKYG